MKKKIMALISLATIAAAGGTGSYKVKMSDQQKIIDITTYKNGYINIRQIGKCGHMAPPVGNLFL
jgi:hypothetical protein